MNGLFSVSAKLRVLISPREIMVINRYIAICVVRNEKKEGEKTIITNGISKLQCRKIVESHLPKGAS